MIAANRAWPLIALTVCVVGVGLLGCRPENRDPVRPAEPPKTDPMGSVRPDEPKKGDAIVPVDPADVNKAVAGNNALAFKLFEPLGKVDPKGNLAFSPYSVSEVMALPYRGARGKTAEEMTAALGYTLPADRLPKAFRALDLRLASTEAPKEQSTRVGLRVSDSPEGVRIEEVQAGSPADKAGLKKGQLLLTLDGHKLSRALDCYQLLAERPGESVTFEVRYGANSTAPYRVLLPTPTAAPCRLTTANGVWGRPGLVFQPEFLQSAGELGAAVEEVNFADPEAARKVVNDWFALKTDGQIKDLVAAGAIKPDTSVLMTNAVSFQGLWEQDFKKDSTLPDLFTRGTEKLKVPMMQQLGSFRIYSGEDFKILEMPVKGSSLALVLVLPDKSVPLEKFEEKWFTEARLVKWLGEMRERQVRVRLPRFKAATQADLHPVLAGLGMPTAFSQSADFQGVATGKGKALLLDQVVHRATLEVDETGITASAASYQTMRPKTPRPQEDTFVADRPFLFVLRDRTTGLILFMGRVTEPEHAS